MSRTYEMMYLLDNDTVRAGWKEAKAGVTALVEKHGGKVLTSRRWDERRLAYPIKRRRRGTFLLVHSEMPPEGVTPLRRELDLADQVLRYLILSVDQVPAEELELTSAEAEAGFVVPPPPEEDVEEVVEQASSSDESSDSGGTSSDDSDDSDEEKTKDVEARKAAKAGKGSDEENEKSEDAAVAEGAAKEEN